MTHRQDKIRLGTVFANDPKKVIDYPFGLNDVLGICCPFGRVKYGAYVARHTCLRHVFIRVVEACLPFICGCVME